MEKKVIIKQCGACTVVVKFPVFKRLPAGPACLMPVQETKTFARASAALEEARSFLCPSTRKGEKP